MVCVKWVLLLCLHLELTPVTVSGEAKDWASAVSSKPPCTLRFLSIEERLFLSWLKCSYLVTKQRISWRWGLLAHCLSPELKLFQVNAEGSIYNPKQPVKNSALTQRWIVCSPLEASPFLPICMYVASSKRNIYSPKAWETAALERFQKHQMKHTAPGKVCCRQMEMSNKAFSLPVIPHHQ